jgi:hypothetical protein
MRLGVGCRFAGIAVLVLFLGASDLRAQNQVQNPGFTGGLGFWTTLPGSVTVGWDPVQGNSAPGAVSVDVPASGGGQDVFFLSQCLPAQASTLYDVGGSFRYPSSVATVPRGNLVVQAFADGLCTTPAGALGGFGLSIGTSPADTWIVQSYAKGYTTTATTAAVKIFLRLLTTADGAAFGWFDDMSFVPSALDYFTVPPCRVVDTRDLGAPIGGPAVGGQETRPFAVAGNCGIPATARALSVNVAVTAPTSGGNLRLFASGEAVPTVATITYSAGQTRANNAVVKLNNSGSMSAFVGQLAGNAVHLIVDVNGYFQ